VGRHSSPDQGPFYRSFGGWIAVWLVIAGVTGIAVWFAVSAIGSDVADPTETSPANDRSTPEPSPSQTTAEATPTETPSPVDNTDVKLITDDVTVQILNGTLDSGAALRMSNRLDRLGYSVVAVEESSRAYSDTTVFWSYPESKEAAVALAEHFGWVAEQRPANLSSEVAIHVVVGADETG
jgi:cytoskeletal protein RodZ